MGALNFVLRDSLDGGATRTLCMDGYGKVLSFLQPDLEVEIPEECNRRELDKACFAARHKSVMDLTNFEKVSGMSILRRREQLRRVGGCIQDYCGCMPLDCPSSEAKPIDLKIFWRRGSHC